MKIGTTRIMLSATFAVGALGFVASPAIAQQQPAAASPAKPAKKAIYDEAADAKQQISAAVERAAKERKRVLVQWGGNWCPWCIRLHELFKADRDIARTLQYEYEIVLVDSGKPAGKNVELAKAYGAEVDKFGFPFLTILDPAANTGPDLPGKAIANQETGGLEKKSASGESVSVAAGHDPALVLKFLTEHKPEYANAQALLDASLAKAKESGKVVFVHFGAPWCVWCHRMEAWMAKPRVAELLAKDFIDLKIDVDRTIGGNDIHKKFNPSGGGGIPWFVFLDGSGKPIADSNASKGNVGFPAAPEEIAHFEQMLKKAAKNLDAAAITELTESLKAAAPAQH
jgi:thiol:disulfide interchange protein